MQLLNLKLQQIEWRRSQVFELSSKGHNQSEIAKILQVDKWTVSRDISYLRGRSKTNIRKYIDEILPEEYEKCLVGLTSILKEAWKTAQESSDKREKIQALSLAKDCYSMKLDLLTNATVVDDAVRFVSSYVGLGKVPKVNGNIEGKTSNSIDDKVQSINTYNVVF